MPLPKQQTKDTNLHALIGIWTCIPATERLQTYALDRTATRIAISVNKYQRTRSAPERQKEEQIRIPKWYIVMRNNNAFINAARWEEKLT